MRAALLAVAVALEEPAPPEDAAPQAWRRLGTGLCRAEGAVPTHCYHGEVSHASFVSQKAAYTSRLREKRRRKNAAFKYTIADPMRRWETIDCMPA